MISIVANDGGISVKDIESNTSLESVIHAGSKLIHEVGSAFKFYATITVEDIDIKVEDNNVFYKFIDADGNKYYAHNVSVNRTEGL